MRDKVLRTPPRRQEKIHFSQEERAQLNTIIDLLIPSDVDFPPPSSLHLIDEFLYHLHSPDRYGTSSGLNEKQLRTVLYSLNTWADGNFCCVSTDRQRRLLQYLEQQDPAVFQFLWTLTNHSYYTSLATSRRPAHAL
jgi:hypothetical protein